MPSMMSEAASSRRPRSLPPLSATPAPQSSVVASRASILWRPRPARCWRGGGADPGLAHRRAALDAVALAEFRAGAARAGNLLDRRGLRDLFPPDPDAGVG